MKPSLSSPDFALMQDNDPLLASMTGYDSELAKLVREVETRHLNLKKDLISEFVKTQKSLQVSQYKIAEELKYLQESIRKVKDRIHDLSDSKRLSAEIQGYLLSRIDHLNLSIIDLNYLRPRTESPFLQAFVGRVNTKLDLPRERIKYKTDYEQFRLKMTPLIIVLALVINFFPHPRSVDMYYQMLLVFFYLSLAFRENILKENGSKIKSWWIWWHYLLMLICIGMMVWPDGEFYRAFSPQFNYFILYLSIVQILQTRYQMGRLYVLRALGKATEMDVPHESQIRWSPFMPFLLTVIGGGQLFLLFNGATLALFAFRGAEWEAWILAVLFFVTGFGNIYMTYATMKTKRARQTQFKIKSQETTTSSQPTAAKSKPN